MKTKPKAKAAGAKIDGRDPSFSLRVPAGSMALIRKAAGITKRSVAAYFILHAETAARRDIQAAAKV